MKINTISSLKTWGLVVTNSHHLLETLAKVESKS